MNRKFVLRLRGRLMIVKGRIMVMTGASLVSFAEKMKELSSRKPSQFERFIKTVIKALVFSILVMKLLFHSTWKDTFVFVPVLVILTYLDDLHNYLYIRRHTKLRSWYITYEVANAVIVTTAMCFIIPCIIHEPFGVKTTAISILISATAIIFTAYARRRQLEKETAE